MPHPRSLLVCLALAAAPTAWAADFDAPYPRRPPPDWSAPGPRAFGPHAFGPRDFGPRDFGPPPCRTVFEPRPGPFGEERVRRVRVCDGGFRGPPRWSHGAPAYRDAEEPHERPALAPQDDFEE